MGREDYYPPFDVIAACAIAVKRRPDRHGYEGRAHSLWFGDAQVEGVYRWYELAFMVTPTIPEGFTVEPFALPPNDPDAASAVLPGMGRRQLAWQPLPFDQGEEERFVERWMAWLAEAAEGTLSRPSRMPEDSGGSYRAARPRTR